jgi:choline dehydrogenase
LQLESEARGTVPIRSPHVDDAPLIAPRYLITRYLISTDEDRLVAAQSLRLTRRIAAQPALAA